MSPRTMFFFALASLIAPAAHSQSNPSIAGDYTGLLGGALHLKLHISASNGDYTGTLDSLDQGANGIPCSDFHLEAASLSFRVPAVGGTWKGTVSADGNTLTGAWTQAATLPLTFTRDVFVPAEKPSPIDGFWLGSLDWAGRSFRAQLTLKSDRSGREFCSFDSLDQGVLAWDCAPVHVNGGEVSFAVPKAPGKWSGRLSADGQSLTGTWTQGKDRPLNFARQSAALPIAAPPTDPALAPPGAAGILDVINRDLDAARAPFFRAGPLSEGTGAGLAIGVLDHGVRRVFAFGDAKADSIFEIGSISKTFTALILARMVERGVVRYDTPVGDLLPPGAVPKPSTAGITLLDLATQHSGLPRMPSNFHPADVSNPYVDYKPADLYAFLATHGIARPASAPFLYSNLGFGLLGQALSNRAGLSYADLLAREVTAPLALHDTALVLSPAQTSRFVQGHDAAHRPAHAWDFDAFAGAGAIRSTASDMLVYLDAQLHPEKFPALAASISDTHGLRAPSLPGMQIGLAWLYVDKDAYYWHNGGTGGFSSFAFFDPAHDCAAIVLFNTTLGDDGSFADRLGAHLRQRLLGQPALTLTH